MKWKRAAWILAGITTVAIAIYVAFKVKRKQLLEMAAASSQFFGNLLSGRQELRSDAAGDGSYGASRGGRAHDGVDVVVIAGQTVYSPIHAIVERKSYPYANDMTWEGVYLKGIGEHEGFNMKIFYMKPDPGIIGKEVNKGQRIGVAQAISQKYPGQGMTDHVHVELYALGQEADPTNFLINNNYA